MKKLFLILLTVVLVFSATACGRQPVTYNQEKPYWLPEESFGNTVDKTANEVCVYDITYQKLEEKANAFISLEVYDGSTYTTELTASTYNDADCYLLTTTLDVNGKYTVTENNQEVDSIEFNDVVVAKTYFLWDNGVKAKYSIQTAQSTFPVSSTGAMDKHGNRFFTISYETTTTYGDKDAQTTFRMIGDEEQVEKMKPYFSLQDGFTGTIKKYSNGNYIDVNAIYFTARSFDFSVDFNYTFYSISVLENVRHSLKVMAKEAVTITIDELTYDGKDASGSTVPSYSLEFGLNETYGGQTIICKYFEDSKTWRHFMYQMITPLSYNVGNLVYTLKQATSSR